MRQTPGIPKAGRLPVTADGSHGLCLLNRTPQRALDTTSVMVATPRGGKPPPPCREGVSLPVAAVLPAPRPHLPLGPSVPLPGCLIFQPGIPDPTV